MLVQEKQADMPQHLVLCTGQFSRENLSSKSMLLRKEFYSNQTILGFCENWIIWRLVSIAIDFPATAGAIRPNKASLERLKYT